jgi:hypothetical protein
VKRCHRRHTVVEYDDRSNNCRPWRGIDTRGRTPEGEGALPRENEAGRPQRTVEPQTRRKKGRGWRFRRSPMKRRKQLRRNQEKDQQYDTQGLNGYHRIPPSLPQHYQCGAISAVGKRRRTDGERFSSSTKKRNTGRDRCSRGWVRLLEWKRIPPGWDLAKRVIRRQRGLRKKEGNSSNDNNYNHLHQDICRDGCSSPNG